MDRIQIVFNETHADGHVVDTNDQIWQRVRKCKKEMAEIVREHREGSLGFIEAQQLLDVVLYNNRVYG